MLEQTKDWLIADPTGLAVNLFFAVTIILMLMDKQKPPVATSLMTGLALIVLGIGGSFNASVISVASIINGCLWLFVGLQRYRQKNEIVEQN